MNAKRGYAGAVLLVLLTGPLTQAQTPLSVPYPKAQTAPAAPPTPPTPPMDPSSAGSVPASEAPLNLPQNTPSSAIPSSVSPAPGLIPAGAAGLPPAIVPDPWMFHQQPEPFNQGCCGPTGRDGPIGWDVYANTGPALLYSNTAYAKSLNTGLEVDGGWRSLFFNRDADQAWLIDLNLVYNYNDGNPKNAFTLVGNPVTLRNLDRTAVGLGIGHDWFVFGPGSVGRYWDANVRYGFDAGARWGTQHLDFNIVGTDNGYLRHQDGFGAAYGRLHFDVDVPMGGWTFFAGIVCGFNYTFSGAIIPHINTNLHELDTLITAGVRY